MRIFPRSSAFRPARGVVYCTAQGIKRYSFDPNEMKSLVILVSMSLTLNVVLWLIDSPYFGPIGAPNLFVLLTAFLVIYPPVLCLSLFTNIRPFVAISAPESVLVVIWNTFFWSLVIIAAMKLTRTIRTHTRAGKPRSNQSS